MKTLNLSVKEARENQKRVNDIVASARRNFNDIMTSFFTGINIFNKIAAGNGNGLLVGANNDGIKALASELKNIHCERYGFTASLLPKDKNGRICVTRKSAKMPIWDYQLIDIENGRYMYLYPVEAGMTYKELFNVFGDIAKSEARAKVAEARASEARAKVAKTLAKEREAVTAVFGELAETFTDDMIHEKYLKIRAAK